MNSQEVFHDRKVIRGFTLVEMLLVTSLLLVLGIFTVPVGLSFYTAQQHSEATEGIHDALKKAQVYAFSGKSDSAYGVYVEEGAYTLFKGASYIDRDTSEDLVFPLYGRLSVEGLSEIVFSAHSLTPQEPGAIHIHSPKRSETITVSSGGRIDH